MLFKCHNATLPINAISGFPQSGKSQGKMNFFQGQGKVREF